jgi:hypothetical protein
MHIANPVLDAAKGFGETVDAIAGQTEHGIDPPFLQNGDDVIGDGIGRDSVRVGWARLRRVFEPVTNF